MLRFPKGFYTDVRIEERFTTTIGYRDGALEESKQTSTKKAFIRVFDGEMWYYASTYKTDELQREVDALCAGGTPNPDIENNETVKRFQVNTGSYLRFTDECVKDIPLAKKQAMLQEKFPVLKETSETVKMFVARYRDRYSRYEFYSSKGADLEYDFQVSGVSYGFAMGHGEDTFENAVQQGKAHFSEIDLTNEQVAEAIRDGEGFLLHAKAVTAGSYPVILAPMVAGVFAHESFGHKSEADFMIGDETMKREWAIGKKVGADILSIYDSGLDFGAGYVPFDDEGTRASKTYLIKKGVLAGRLHSVATSAELGEEPTGNARAIDCNFEPIPRMTNTVIEAGDKTKEELFAGIKHGYFIKDLKHGSGMSTFTIAPNLAYEIVDGKIAGPVKIAVITGSVFETLNLIDGLSDKAEEFSFVLGGCGKMEQYPLSVGFGGPYVSVSKMIVQ